MIQKAAGTPGRGGRQAGPGGAAGAGGGRRRRHRDDGPAACCGAAGPRVPPAACGGRGKLASAGRSALISRVTGELAGLAEATAAQAAAVPRNGRRAVPYALSGRMRGRLRRALGELAVTIERTAKIVGQARTRMAGLIPDGASRLVACTTAMPGRSPRAGGPTRRVRVQGPGRRRRQRRRRRLRRRCGPAPMGHNWPPPSTG